MISYSGLTNYGKASLPSVVSWGTNNNILKDPPRSLTTYRRDKVGDTSYLVEEIDGSSDRAAEAIMAYPRGVNPMVGVSYTDFSGGVGAGQALFYRGVQGKLPYRVADRGAFRPPILAPVDLLPLSRMPRVTTRIDPIVYRPDFRKRVSCAAEKRTTKSVLQGEKITAKSGARKDASLVPVLENKVKEQFHIAAEGTRLYRPDFRKRDWNAAEKRALKPVLKGEKNSAKSGARNDASLVPVLENKTRDQIHYAVEANKLYNPDKHQQSLHVAPRLKDIAAKSATAAASGQQKFVTPTQVSSFRREVLHAAAEAPKQFAAGKEQRARHVEPLIRRETLAARADSAVSKTAAGGARVEDYRGPSSIVARRRGAVLLPAVNHGTWALPERAHLEYKSVMNRKVY